MIPRARGRFSGHAPRIGGGRVFYTALGHEEGVWRDYRFQQMLRNAALWALRRSP
jgi:type 1 glutamine amidotransferase